MHIDLTQASKHYPVPCMRWVKAIGRTLLLEKSSLTPRPELLCIIVLYSPSSSSLRS
jgi:hypothetical protein